MLNRVKKSLDILAKLLQPTVRLLTFFHKVNLSHSNKLESTRTIKSFFAKLLSANSPQPVLVHEIAPSQTQDFPLGFVELQSGPLRPA